MSLTDFMLLRAGWAGDKCLSSEDLQLMRVSCIPPERETDGGLVPFNSNAGLTLTWVSKI